MFNRTKIISSLKTRNIPHFPREKQNELFKKAFEMSFKCIEPICNNIVDVNYRNNLHVSWDNRILIQPIFQNVNDTIFLFLLSNIPDK